MSSKRTKLVASAAMVSSILLLTGGLASCSRNDSPEELVAEAASYQQKGDRKAAIIQLKNALQQKPDDAEARFLLGSIYIETGDSLSAEKELRRAAELGMTKARTAPQLAKSMMLQGQFQKALDELAAAGPLQDANVEITRGDAYSALNKQAESKAAYEKALQLTPDAPLALVGLAKIAYFNKDVDGATRMIDQAIAKNPQNTEALVAKAELLRAQNKNDEALAAYNTALKIKPDHVQNHIAKANLDISMRRFDDASKEIETARKLAPSAPMVSYAQALLDFTQEKHKPALESIQQVLKVAPDHMPSVLLAGAIQFALGSNEQAEQYVKRYMDANPGNVYASKLLASIMLKNNDPQRALAVLNPAIQQAHGTDSQLLSLAGESYMRSRDFPKATEAFEKATALSPQTPMLRTALGMSKLAQGENASGMAELEMASNMDTKNAQPGMLLVMNHLRLREYDKALAAVKKLEKEKPNDATVKTLRGNVHLSRKELPLARQSFEEAVKLQAGYFPPVVNLAQIDFAEKKPDAGRARIEAFLEKDKDNVEAITALASLTQAQGKTAEAIALLERASNAKPADIPAALRLGTAYLRTNEKQKASALAQRLVISFPSSPEVLDFSAQTQLANGDKDAALDTYRKLAGLVPNSALAQYRIATVQMSMQNQGAAVEALKKAISLKPDYLDAQVALAAVQVRSNKPDEALAIARQIQKQLPKAPVGFSLEGDLMMLQQKPAEAIKPYEQALAANGGNAVLMKLHEALTKTGRTKDADARVAAWLKAHPEDNAVRLHFATLSMASNNKAAIEQFQAILKQDPNNVGALNNLALALYKEKDPRALEYAEKAATAAPANPAVMDTLGFLLVENGDVKRGLPYLEKAVAAAPNAVTIRYNLALAQAKAGDKESARKSFEEVIAKGGNSPKVEEAKAMLKTL
nr:XrtA/PEP-CTERM system TPR-repeat protein PrsT [uncultured Noviherbaspirillum sp.]